MKRIILLLTIVFTANYAIDAASRDTLSTHVLAIKDQVNHKVKGYPSYAECKEAKRKAIKKDGKAWDCFPVSYE